MKNSYKFLEFYKKKEKLHKKYSLFWVIFHTKIVSKEKLRSSADSWRFFLVCIKFEDEFLEFDRKQFFYGWKNHISNTKNLKLFLHKIP